jgi:hypothetical protein
MKYLGKSFSSPANSRAFVDNWDSVFGEPAKTVKCRECQRVYRVNEGATSMTCHCKLSEPDEDGATQGVVTVIP